MKTLSVSNLLGIKYLNEEDLHLIFETAIHFKEVINRPIKKVPSLRDITIANLFFENSTRTKLSFELAEKRLSADTLNFSANQSSLTKGETLVDTVNNILAMKIDIDGDGLESKTEARMKLVIYYGSWFIFALMVSNLTYTVSWRLSNRVNLKHLGYKRWFPSLYS